jgi:WD40 repeat protein
MTCHEESLKFWDIRKGGLPFKTYDRHHNLLTQAKYNHSHDELIVCGYDDGSTGLLRLVSASSSMDVDVEDAMVRLYDEHEDPVLSVEWGRSSAWMFVSISSSPSLLVLNLVPNAEKYRILL